MPSKLIDETGNKYGSLTVKNLTKDKNGRTAWLCECDCGNTKIVRGSDLRTNKVVCCSKSCPCKKTTLIDEVGNIYGDLTVISKSTFKSSSNKTMWHCKCSCGKEIDVLGESLRRNLTSSCGCKSKELNAKNHSKDLTNIQYGLLIPLEIYQKNQSTEGNIWRCKCLCGCNREDVLVPTHRLTSGTTKSCGKIRQSFGELSVEDYLIKNNINFKKEYSFENLISQNNKKLRFDFAIFKNDILLGLIEFDGLQHFKSIEYFGGEKEFQERIKNDNMKNLYCKNNNIPLLRIRYDENIEEKIKLFLKELF